MNLSKNFLLSQKRFFLRKFQIKFFAYILKIRYNANCRFLYAGVMWKSNQLTSQKEKRK